MTHRLAFGFDLDGTLVETEVLKARSYVVAVRDLRPGLDCRDEIEAMYGSLVGRSREEVASTILRQFDLEELARARETALGVTDPAAVLAALHARAYEAMLDDRALVTQQIYPATCALLRRVRAEGYRTGLATMSHAAHAHRVIDLIDVRPSFDVILVRDDVARPKPHPEIYLLLAERLGVAPKDCLIIEDSLPGVQAALAAGSACIAVTTPYTRASVHGAEILPPERIVDERARLESAVESALREIQ